MEINLEEIIEPACFDNGTISPSLKPKDGEIYCNHYEFDFCPYRNDKDVQTCLNYSFNEIKTRKLTMYCNYYKHISYVVGLEFMGDSVHEKLD